MYYLYRLSSQDTKHYYIGVTDNPARRERQHYAIIRDLIHETRRPAIKVSLVKSKAIHRLLAKQVVPKVKQYIWPKTIIKWYYNFNVIGTSESSEAIAIMESKMLSIGDKFLMNDILASSYNHTTK